MTLTALRIRCERLAAQREQLAAEAQALGATAIPIEQTKPTDFVMIPGSKVVYKRGHYDRASKSFSLTNCDDMNAERFVKRGRVVFVGFTY